MQCLLTASFLACSVEAIQFDCFFSIHNLSPLPGSRYTCLATVINTGSPFLENVTSDHWPSDKSNDDVENLHIVGQNLTFIPGGVSNFFKNLDALTVQFSSLTLISADDLKPFPRLVYIFLGYNKLSSHDGDLFKHTPHLQYASFEMNKIQHIGHDLVENLNNLIYLYFIDNDCINHWAETRAAVLSLGQKLSFLCPPLDFMTTEATTSLNLEQPLSK